jgi:hypothetical protein
MIGIPPVTNAKLNGFPSDFRKEFSRDHLCLTVDYWADREWPPCQLNTSNPNQMHTASPIGIGTHNRERKTTSKTAMQKYAEIIIMDVLR